MSSITNISHSYLAGLFDSFGRIRVKDQSKIIFVVRGPESVLANLQANLGGKAYRLKSGPYLTLSVRETLEVARYLVSVPSRYQSAYQAILDYDRAKSEYSPQDQQYRQRIQSILERVRTIDISFDRSADYQAGFTGDISRLPIVSHSLQFGEPMGEIIKRQALERKVKENEKLAARLAKKQETTRAREIKKQKKIDLRLQMQNAKRLASEERRQKLTEEKRLKQAAKDTHRIWEISLTKQGSCYCRKCQEVLSINQFNKSPNTHTRLSLYCKVCHKENYYNKDRSRENSKAWRKSNPDKWRIISRRIKSKPHQRVRANISKRVKGYLSSRDTNWRSCISCSPCQLVEHLESQFDPSMSWSNYGTHWHIDHIIPCAAFDMTKRHHVLACWHHKNLRPLAARLNELKGDALPTGESAEELKKTDPARLLHLIANAVQDMGILSAKEFVAT